jgi:hypothetical protein
VGDYDRRLDHLQRVALILTRTHHACTIGLVDFSAEPSVRLMRYGSITLKSAVEAMQPERYCETCAEGLRTELVIIDPAESPFEADPCPDDRCPECGRYSCGDAEHAGARPFCRKVRAAQRAAVPSGARYTPANPQLTLQPRQQEGGRAWCGGSFWGARQARGCIGYGKRQYSAVLHSVPWGGRGRRAVMRGYTTTRRWGYGLQTGV